MPKQLEFDFAPPIERCDFCGEPEADCMFNGKCEERRYNDLLNDADRDYGELDFGR